MVLILPSLPLAAACSFTKTATLPIIIFEVIVILGFIASVWFISRIEKQWWQQFLTMAVGVLLFELFTAPMWNNHHMGEWAYIYDDVSWILLLCWTALILTIVTVVDRFLSEWKASKRFLVYLGVLIVAVTILEAIVVNIGIRSYAPEVLRDMVNIFILGVPIVEVFYYTPVFTGLVIAFHKYWMLVLGDEPFVPIKYRQWLRSLGLALLAVFLLEMLVQPMVDNVGFPRWSYLVFDITLVLIVAWVAIIGVTALVVEKYFLHYPTWGRFLLALGIAGTFILLLETVLINQGYRVYGASAVSSFVGFTVPQFNIPIEVVFAVPCYLGLIISFIRYWEITLDNRL
ncbi:hypothetical protein K4A83_12245 [Spirulina subsalsa FACHB-351]|uniref:Uncharacterized protein n=1 Tax=Spirulina subsalsa FACHB-351 TaxID=234711 RepID=A0ABT3L691_9CYAN|nr:hypothetical protein [Spirulina subsalsa]MCW6037031.1 hypothetical protein [Spirulina subsalsa FACHB-351]